MRNIIEEEIEKIIAGRDLSKEDHVKVVAGAFKNLCGQYQGSMDDASAAIIDFAETFQKVKTGFDAENKYFKPTSRKSKKPDPGDEIIKIGEVMKMTGLGRLEISALKKEGKFPESISQGQGSIGWKQNDIEEYIKNRDKVDAGILDAIGGKKAQRR